MLQRLAEDLVMRGWMLASRYGFDSFRRYPRRDHLPSSKPGEIIERLPTKEREEVKKLKPEHFNHEMMFKE